ncbi:hypothetical protein ACFYE2_15100 [Kocuria sp. CPCC 205300]|uniref:hypothetical protein n=1 Tax=Kocuria sabuli TaxID=3071448 RepID=UPI0036DF3DCE
MASRKAQGAPPLKLHIEGSYLVLRQKTFARFVVDPEPTVGGVALCIEVDALWAPSRGKPERPERRIPIALGLRSGSHHDGVKVGAIGAPVRNGAGSHLSTLR